MQYVDSTSKLGGHLDRVVAWRRDWHVAPVTVEWDLSNRCTLGCQDCHFAHTHVRGPWTRKDRVAPPTFESTGDLADLKVVGRATRMMSDSGVQSLVWSGGGEPTTHPDWQRAVLLAHDAGLEQGMYTLGGLLDPHKAEFLALYLSWIVVSLDCADRKTYFEEKGSRKFSAACDGVKWLAEAGATVGASFLLHAENWTDVVRMRELAKRLGATYALFRPAVQATPTETGWQLPNRKWMEAALPVLVELSQDPFVEVNVARFQEYGDWTSHGYSTCRGVQLVTTVTPDGRMWLCPQRRGMADSCLGDLRVESFNDIWSRFSGQWKVDSHCRPSCRYHAMNQQLAAWDAPRTHGAFL